MVNAVHSILDPIWVVSALTRVHCEVEKGASYRTPIELASPLLCVQRFDKFEFAMPGAYSGEAGK